MKIFNRNESNKVKKRRMNYHKQNSGLNNQQYHVPKMFYFNQEQCLS